MIPIVVLWAVVAAPAGGGFEDAAVKVVESSDAGLVVELAVTVAVEDGPVVAHVRTPGRDWVTHLLVDRGDSRWSTLLDLRRVDWTVVFEAVGAGRMSEPARLTELGLDPGELAAGAATTPPAPETFPAYPWGWLAVACGAAGLSIAFGAWAAQASFNPRHLRPPARSRRSGPS